MIDGFKVVNGGIQSLIQDRGRFGFNHLGITTSGPMDQESFYWANKLCGNDLNAPAIEVTIGGLELEAKLSTYIAITGAKVPVTLNDQNIKMWETIPISKGEILKFDYMLKGMRAYLATAGGFMIKNVFGSCATTVRESIGGLSQNGSPLKSSDLIPCESYKLLPPLKCETKPSHIENEIMRSISTIRVVLGYQSENFSNDQKDIFFNSEYEISERNDRMGIRILGRKIQSSITNMLSEGISLGAIQIPQDGQPIILMNDRQTIGGYPKIGSIISDDLDKLSQLNQGDKINFQVISKEEAHNLLSLRYFRISKNIPKIDSRTLALQVQKLLVKKNCRGMSLISEFLPKDAYFRAAKLLNKNHRLVFIGTGFPVNGSFETDGPLGAIAIYKSIKVMGGEPYIVCDNPLFDAIKHKFNAIEITPSDDSSLELINKYNPSLIMSIERPGKNKDGRYYNMRGVDISEKCANFDSFFENARCPKISIGDGGNEIGMGNVESHLYDLNIKPSSTTCDELLVADVSNWAAHGLLAILSVINNKNLFEDWNNEKILKLLCSLGAVDGVSGESSITEDGFSPKESELVIDNLKKLSRLC